MTRGDGDQRAGERVADERAARRQRLRAAVRPVGTLLLFALALWVSNDVLAEYTWADVRQALASVPLSALALAVAATALNYLALVGYDAVALRIIGHPLPLRATFVPAFASFAIANVTPAPVLTGGGVRYRMYADQGISAAEATAVTGMNVVTYALGLCAVAGAALVVHPVVPEGMPAWLSVSGRTLGVVLLIAVAGYFAAVLAGRGELRLFGHAVSLPSPRLAAVQLGVSVADWLLSSWALYVLLASLGGLAFVDFLVRFLVAQVAALLSPLPGGLGVFDAVVLYLTASGVPAPRVLAALLVYRVVYYVLPLIVAGALMLGRGLRRAGQDGRRPVAWLADVSVQLAPHLVAFTTFSAGTLLMLTGTIPADQERLAWLARLLPPPLIELSHFLASVLGAALLVVAWGIEAGVRSAYRIARLLFGVGIVLSLLRGSDPLLAIALVGALVVLLAAGRAFPPTASGAGAGPAERTLLTEPMSPAWIVAIGLALLVTLSVGLFAFHGVDYSREPWWRVTLEDGDAPRALRAAVGASVTLLLFALARFFARSAPLPGATAGAERDGDAAPREMPDFRT